MSTLQPVAGSAYAEPTTPDFALCHSIDPKGSRAPPVCPMKCWPMAMKLCYFDVACAVSRRDMQAMTKIHPAATYIYWTSIGPNSTIV